ncbi:MAG: MFS transporter, partial [Ruminiclostridium sp.]
MKNRNSLALILMIIIVGFLNADQNIMSATLETIEKEFNVNDYDIGIMSALFTVVGAVISIIWGYLSDKKNRKILFTVSILIAEIPCLLTAFSQNYEQFFILRILTGIGVGASFPTTFSMLGDMFDEKKRAGAVTWLVTVMGVGQIAGMAIGGYLGPAFGWRIPFIVATIPGIIATVFFCLFVSEPKRGVSEESLKDLIAEGYVYSRTIKLSDYIGLAKVRTNVYLFIQGLVGTIPWGATLLFLIKFLTQNRGFSTEQATTVFLFFGLGTIVGIVAGGTLGGRLFKKKEALVPILCSITTFAGSVVALMIFVLPLGNNLPVTILLGFSASFILSITSPNVKKMLMDVNVPENRGTIYSVFNLTDSVGTGIGKWIGGILSVSFG